MSMLKGKTAKELLQSVKNVIPPLLDKFHKGQAGRIAVIGGCEDYTGAPYFSAMASSLLGADMSHVICEHTAGQVIKTYSPNFMVHPYLYDSNTVPRGTTVEDVLKKVTSILDRVHVIVVGPGLGRDDLMLRYTSEIIKEAKQRDLPVVIDADGLYLIQNDIDLIKGYKHAVLTPNVVEFGRLQKAVGLEKDEKDRENDCARLSKALGGVVIIEKGTVDYISNGERTVIGNVDGSLKRVSGQGDTLSGSVATFLAWKLAYQNKIWDVEGDYSDGDLMLLSALGGSCVTRMAARLAFEENHRAMVTSDVTSKVGQAYINLFMKGLS